MRYSIWIVCMTTLMVGCASTKAPKPPHAESPQVIVAAPAPKPLRIDGGELTLSDLQGKLTLRDREFIPGSNPKLSVTIENRHPTEPLVLEVAAAFSDAEGNTEPLEWSRADIPAGGSHQFVAESDKPANDVKLLLREVTTKPG